MTWEIEIQESIQERLERDGYALLTEPERLYHGVWWLFFVAYGPGFLQYFRNIEVPHIIAARKMLEVIGKEDMLMELNAAIKLLPDSLFAMSASDRSIYFDTLDKATENRLIKICDRFTDRPYPANELESFVAANNSSFLGPRTKIELWKSKYDRGINTAPKFTVKKFDAETEAAKDRNYSTRSCPICDYPSPDYRPSCKRCGFPHGRA